MKKINKVFGLLLLCFGFLFQSLQVNASIMGNILYQQQRDFDNLMTALGVSALVISFPMLSAGALGLYITAGLVDSALGKLSSSESKFQPA